jgi:enamine deaminase RidA (YjgF/YER057c/UK114 family)
MTTPEARLADLGLTLPDPVAPVANYVPYARQGALVFVSGQISIGSSGLVSGRLGETLKLEDGVAAARLCALNIIAQFKAAANGDLAKVRRIIRLGGFVSAAPDFTDIPEVINGASDLMVDVFGESGRHARAAVACPVLPRGAAVEVDAIAVIDE